jgi:hypothetical protein
VRLPTFLVIGAAKGGTTSLHFYLRQHPDVFMPAVKETNFYWAEGRAHRAAIPSSLADYARFFAAATTERAIGEVAPQYLNSATAAQRIRQDLPDVRLIVCLRNPADRAYSDYLGRVRITRESRPIDQAIRPGERIFEDGLYHQRLRRYLERFPREQLHVMLYDDFARDASATLRGLFQFLGVDPDARIDTARRYNPAGSPRWAGLNRLIWRFIRLADPVVPSHWRGTGILEAIVRRTYRPAPPFPSELRKRLIDAYRSDIEATAELIGCDLSHWLQPRLPLR